MPKLNIKRALLLTPTKMDQQCVKYRGWKKLFGIPPKGDNVGDGKLKIMAAQY